MRMYRGSSIAGLVLSCLCASAAHTALAQDARPRNPFEGDPKAAMEGKSLFNQNCAHCHGPDAVTGVIPRNLRRLRARHGEDTAVVFSATVHTGRLAKGMPSWRGVIEDADLWRIYTFLETVQDGP